MAIEWQMASELTTLDRMAWVTTCQLLTISDGTPCGYFYMPVGEGGPGSPEFAYWYPAIAATGYWDWCLGATLTTLPTLT